MVLQKEDYVMLVCMCCMDIHSRKKLLDIGLNYRDGSTVTLIHSCPTCGKHTKTEYQLFGAGALKRGEGYRLKGYGKGK